MTCGRAGSGSRRSAATSPPSSVPVQHDPGARVRRGSRPAASGERRGGARTHRPRPQHGGAPVGACTTRRGRRPRAARPPRPGRSGVVGPALLARRVIRGASVPMLGVRLDRRAAAAGVGGHREPRRVGPEDPDQVVGVMHTRVVERACRVGVGEGVPRLLPHDALHRLRVPEHDGRPRVGQRERDVDELPVVLVGEEVLGCLAPQPPDLVDLRVRLARHRLADGRAPVADPLGHAGHDIATVPEGRSEDAVDSGLLEGLPHRGDVVPLARVELALGQ